MPNHSDHEFVLRSDYVPPAAQELFTDTIRSSGSRSPLGAGVISLRHNKAQWVDLAMRLVRFWSYDEAYKNMPEFAKSEPGYKKWKFLCSIAEQANELDDT